MSMSITVDMSQFAKRLNAIKADVDAAVRPAAQAGAQVLYEAVRNNVPVSNKGHWFHGTMFKVNGTKYFFEAGTLKKSIYQVFSKDKSNDKRSVYHVAWNHRECPYGFMVEFGTSRSAARPFLRPAKARMGDALEAAKKEFLTRLQNK